mmetsp:Transcript_141851/g.453270  ORF Transcript_141851/g.453270 Transcript_141851/m.453270 type:complete len:290 (+) Transcript_141851:110-979(+)
MAHSPSHRRSRSRSRGRGRSSGSAFVACVVEAGSLHARQDEVAEEEEGTPEYSDVNADDSDEEGPVVVDEVLHEEQTPLQHVLVFRSNRFGVCLSLDGVLQSTEEDEHIYHEYLVHVPLALLPGPPRRVLVCGGGPGGAAREVLRYGSVEEGVVAEIDSAVVEVARRFSPRQVCAYADTRCRLSVCDAAEAVRGRASGTFDAIIVDGTDMGVTSGRSNNLWSRTFFADCVRSLRAGGTLSTQTLACGNMQQLFPVYFLVIVGCLHRLIQWIGLEPRRAQGPPPPARRGL